MLEKPRSPWKKAVFSQFKSANGVVTDSYNFAEFDDGQKMLFDLKADPDENVNLAASPEHKKTLYRLGKMLKDGARSCPMKQNGRLRSGSNQPY